MSVNLTALGGERSGRREQILLAAAELFAQHGFHGVGIDDIGAVVGVSGPALYRYFSSKDALLGEMLREISAYLLQGGERLSRAEPNQPNETLTELVRFHVEFALAYPALITVQERCLANLTDSDRKQVRTLQRKYLEIWVEVMGQALPRIAEKTRRSSAHAVFGLINSAPHHRYLTHEELASLLVKLSLGALRAA